MTAPVKFCSQCGKDVATEMRFCAFCGTDVIGGTRAEENVPATMEEEVENQLRNGLVGEYDIAGLLGRGGMALVYRAHEMMLDREVAIKVMPPDVAMGSGMVERFKREAKTAAKLDHPNIIPIYRIGEVGRTVYFAMKYVIGRGLDEVLKDQKTLAPAIVGAIMQQACSALAYAHKAGVIHRDIKPANIMLDQTGWVVVMDFGIAKAGGNSALTATGAAIGTPHYMSPEQCSGSNVTSQSDQYSLGIMTYQMLTGVLPIDGESLPEILVKHFSGIPTPIGELVPDCPVRIQNAVMRSLEKNPLDRFDTLEEFAEEIASLGVNPGITRQLKKLGSAKEQVRVSIPSSPVPLGKTPPVDVAAATTPMPLNSRTKHAAYEQANIATTPMPATKEPPPETIAERPGADAAETKPVKRTKTAAMVLMGLAAAAVATFFALGGPAKFFPPAAGAPGTINTVAASNVGGNGADPGALDGGTAQIGGGLETANTADGQPATVDTADVQTATGPNDAAARAQQEPPRLAPPPTGTFSLTGTPRGASVRIDGRTVTSWSNVTLDPGSHSVTITASGYQEFRRSFIIRAGQTARITGSMQRIAQRQEPAVTPPPVVTQQVEDQHVSCTSSLGQASSTGQAERKAAVVVRDCVPGLYVVFGRGARVEDGLLPAGELIRRLQLRAEGYRSSTRIDTTLAVGDVLVLSGDLQRRN